jgi:hypothetical protein
MSILTPCGDASCLGYVCVYHSLNPDVQDELIDLREKLTRADRVRWTAQRFVDAPQKFGIRHKAYSDLVKALDKAWAEENDPSGDRFDYTPTDEGDK